MLKNKEKSKFQIAINYFAYLYLIINLTFYSIERDAQLLANRIALLKQEEMKTWKKIEETKKRAKEVNDLKRRNEEKMHSKFEQMKMNQMVQEDNQNKIN